MRRRFAAIAATLLPLAAAPPHALAGSRDADGWLPAPPRHAPAGVCYAHVRRQARYAPPPGPRAAWRLSPGPPGSPGPIWCLVETPPGPPILLEAEREGWIRVVCGDDLAPARIRGLQARLHAHGDYDGEPHGRYDQATGAAVARFQSRGGIDERGYLGVRTMEAIERIAGVPTAPFVLSAASLPPPPPPVVFLRRPNPADAFGAPGPHVLTWPGKTYP